MTKTYFIIAILFLCCFLVLNACSNNKTDNTSKPSESNYGKGASSDGKDTNSEEKPTRNITKDNSSIIIYFSRGGNTENLAKQVESLTDSDMLEIQIKEPYPSSYDETLDRVNQEKEDNNYPDLATQIPDLSQYDTVFLGSPVWGMDLSNPMVRFLTDNNTQLEDKNIASFSTNSGYGEGNSVNRISELSPQSDILDNYTVEDKEVKNNKDAVEEWLKKVDILD